MLVGTRTFGRMRACCSGFLLLLPSDKFSSMGRSSIKSFPVTTPDCLFSWNKTKTVLQGADEITRRPKWGSQWSPRITNLKVILSSKLSKCEIPIFSQRGEGGGCWPNFCCWVQNCSSPRFPYFQGGGVLTLLLLLESQFPYFIVFVLGGGVLTPNFCCWAQSCLNPKVPYFFGGEGERVTLFSIFMLCTDALVNNIWSALAQLAGTIISVCAICFYRVDSPELSCEAITVGTVGSECQVSVQKWKV